MRDYIKIRIINIVLVITFFFASGAYYLLEKFNVKAQEPLVIFAGGGSVKNFLLKEKDIDLENRDNLPIYKSVYINMPSEYSWTLLKEEVERFKDKGPDGHSFLYICLSAEKICEDSGRWEKPNPNDAQVYGVYIGEDSLCVYEKDILNDEKKETIAIQELIHTIDTVKKKDDVYTTSRRSGTYAVYKEKMGDSILRSCGLFYESTALDSPFLVLSSKYYPPIKVRKFKKLTVKDSTKVIEKPLYLYFVAFRDNDHYILNKHIGTFLKKLIDNDKNNEMIIRKDEIESWEKNGLPHSKGDSIYYLNE